jgi:hypothetical protein|tara:strand:+ start:221 stop:454 length:234 start_codon:yes stop_codon:yes gene_type:complete
MLLTQTIKKTFSNDNGLLEYRNTSYLLSHFYKHSPEAADKLVAILCMAGVLALYWLMEVVVSLKKIEAVLTATKEDR